MKTVGHIMLVAVGVVMLVAWALADWVLSILTNKKEML